MVHPKDIRLYQDPTTQISDQPIVGDNRWGSEYIYDTFEYGHPNTPAPYRHWDKFPVSDPPMTNKYGDLHMHSDTNAYGWALCEDDNVRLGRSLHKDMVIEESEMATLWKELLGNLEPLGDCLEQLGVSSFPIVDGIYLNTCTPGQLGKMWALMRKVRQCSTKTQNIF